VEKSAKESKEALAKASSSSREATQTSAASAAATNKAARSQSPSPSRKLAAAEAGMPIDDIPLPDDTKVRQLMHVRLAMCVHVGVS
jgi:hypothetical protein